MSARALADTRSIFHPKDDDGRELEPLDHISSADLVGSLATYADSPWAEWGKAGKAISQVQLARLLKPYGIAPEQIRIGGKTQVRGYLRARFEDAWERYL